MTARQMIEMMNKRPFEPFQIHLSDDAKITVEHPYEIATQLNSPICFVFDFEGTIHRIAYRNITQVSSKSSVENDSGN